MTKEHYWLLLPDILKDCDITDTLELSDLPIRSKKDKIRNNTQIYIADTIGELGELMEHRICFYGWISVDHGGQNFLGRTTGKSIIVGPYMYNFIDETEEFKNNAMIMVKTQNRLNMFLRDC